ncbi:hypothetical protein F4809DRAFT_628889 [Biscogniauxia mediterranea]|nr:hypothetical protein F4809DRAFT_628889 [Biscogniauxia mediterranea]
MVFWSREKISLGYESIRKANLMVVLLEAMKEAGISAYCSRYLVGVTETDGETTASFSDSSPNTADLLLGCGGIHSVVWKPYVDPECGPEYLGFANIFPLHSFTLISSCLGFTTRLS